ncbi:hypothetical protein CASFOL_000808 [Castilleja foliolosa]|uniref:Uncharacterized protein n=1 Tax=Castilleja foliolosa TaxID=1961234 RepID=A0ABD3EKQ8_9LAMI
MEVSLPFTWLLNGHAETVHLLLDLRASVSDKTVEDGTMIDLIACCRLLLDPFGDHAILLEKLNESLECKDESSSESEDDTYSDALNALSFTETCSGVSGVRHSGKFLVDKQTRDFMMDRFLPAAKAVILETPKKTMAIDSGPKEMKKVVSVSGEITKPLLRQYGSDKLPPYYRHPDFDNVESDEDEEVSCGGDVPVSSKKAGKSWGINIPKICVKSSLCLLNPLPSMKKSRSRPTTPIAGEERRMRRIAVSGPLDKVIIFYFTFIFFFSN